MYKMEFTNLNLTITSKPVARHSLEDSTILLLILHLE